MRFLAVTPRACAMYLACLLATLFAGCAATTPLAPLAADAAFVQNLPQFEKIESQLPPRSHDTTRLYVYRPQRLLGSSAAPILIIDDYWFGKADRPHSTPLKPGTVVVVDWPAKSRDVWLFQNRERPEDKVSLDFSPGGTYALKLRFRPTHAYLDPVAPSVASEEFEKLRLGGYFSLPGAVPQQVLIDGSEPAYTVFVSLPRSAVEKHRSSDSASASNQYVEWESFIKRQDEIIHNRILHNSYPGSETARGLVELLRRYQGTPIGLTWNGGIAITNNDYAHASKTLIEFNTDPASYKQNESQDVRSDPVHPMGHLAPLLGW